MMNIVIAIAFILPTLLFAAGAVAYCIERNLFRFRRTLSAFLGQSVFARIFLTIFVVAFILHGSSKVDNTNDPPSRTMSPRRQSVRSSGNTVSQDDIVNGYRLLSRVDGRFIAGSDDNVITNRKMVLRGGYEYSFNIESDGWYFPWKDGIVTDLTVRAYGEIKADRETVLPFPIADRVSSLPEARWNLIDGKASCFSYWLDGNGSLLLNWNNALVNRDVNTITNLQVELRRDGGFRLSSEDETHEFAPVLSFDWDGDGLENSVDPEPLIADIDDAHGTNGEWLSTVCSNVFEIADGEINYKEDVNPNAYYFVNLVVERGPVSVTFQADRASRLGSPVVVARPGETNRVPLLAGIEYTVISREAFSLTVPEEYEGVRISITDGNPSTTTVGLPLSFSTEEVQSSQGRSYFVNVVPDNLDGEFHWNSTGDFLGRSSLFSHSSFCGCWTGFGNYISFNCYDACGCGGGCSADGRYSFEGADFDVSIGTCFCGLDFPHDGTGDPDSDISEGGVSVSFADAAIIFENEYTNAPNEVVSRRSTKTRLTLSANGGHNGGTVTFGAENLDRLYPEEGTGPLSIPSQIILLPNQEYSKTFVCSGREHSEDEEDVKVWGTFTDAVTEMTSSITTRVTVVEVQLVPEVLYPAEFPHRHIFGVCEQVGCYILPSSIREYSWQSNGAVFDHGYSQNFQSYQYLLTPASVTFTLFYKCVEYSVGTMSIAPTNIATLSDPIIIMYTNMESECTGGIGMSFELVLCPTNVSFCDINIKEAISADVIHSGYFDDEMFSSWWNHDSTHGADSLVPVGPVNQFGDIAEMTGSCPARSQGVWGDGVIMWMIDTVWRSPVTFFLFDGYHNLMSGFQKFTIDSAGTIGVEKFGYRVERGIGSFPRLIRVD